MMPVREPNNLSHIAPTTTVSPPGKVAPSCHAAVISTLDGDIVTGGTAQISLDGERWRARVSGLDRPGQVASTYFALGVREVILRLADGREARARIDRTSFIAAGERVCDLTGLTPLA